MKLRLKLWVKVTLTIMLMVLFLILLHTQGNKGVDQCQQQGYSKEYCELKLR
jgi:hypothetical protein